MRFGILGPVEAIDGGQQLDLGAAATDNAEPVALDLGDALGAAATVLMHHRAAVTLQLSDPVEVRCRPAVLAQSLPALLLLPCALTNETVVQVLVDGGHASITCSGTPLWPEGRRLAEALAEANGWTISDGPAVLQLRVPIR